MPKQPAFPSLRDAMKKKQTRRELFLTEMDAVVPPSRVLVVIEPHYPRAGASAGGRRCCWRRCSRSMSCRTDMH